MGKETAVLIGEPMLLSDMHPAYIDMLLWYGDSI